jgi:transposase
MDERVKFIARLLDGESMSGLCEEFSISRKTGYKILKRYRDCGVEGLTDRSRRPYRHANQLPLQIETLIVRLKRERPAWGAPKIRERLARLYPNVQRPAISTVHAVLDRHGLVKRRATAPGGRRCRWPVGPMTCGAPTTRASSCSPTGAIAIRSPSPTLPAAISSPARRCTPPGSLCLQRVREPLQRVRPAQGHPYRQRRSLR